MRVFLDLRGVFAPTAGAHFPAHGIFAPPAGALSAHGGAKLAVCAFCGAPFPFQRKNSRATALNSCGRSQKQKCEPPFMYTNPAPGVPALSVSAMYGGVAVS